MTAGVLEAIIWASTIVVVVIAVCITFVISGN